MKKVSALQDWSCAMTSNIIKSSELCYLRGRLPGRNIVLGTGCFDLLHVGHLYFLVEASSQGDVLVVGLNSDPAVKAIKGQGRPFIKEAERAALVAAFRCVDLAFVFDDVVADECINSLKPDVYVIGEESVEGYPSELSAARGVGARVHVVKRMPAASTTAVVAEINKSRP